MFKLGRRAVRKKNYTKKLTEMKEQIMEKYTIREQHLIRAHLSTGRPIEELDKEQYNRQLRF